MNLRSAENCAKRKLIVLFPGLGYTCDKPLLYYTGKLAGRMGFEVVPVPYGGFPKNAKGDREKMRQCFDLAIEQTEQLLKSIDWNRYDDILFVGKSIGTIAAVFYAVKHHLKVRSILFTPLEETFQEGMPEAIAFHGTADPWAETPKIRKACQERKIPLYMTENANHSLETGDVETDLSHMITVMQTVREYIGA